MASSSASSSVLLSKYCRSRANDDLERAQKVSCSVASIVQFTDKGNEGCKLPVQLLNFSDQLGYDFDILLHVREFAGRALLSLCTAARADFFMVVPAVLTKLTFAKKVVPAASNGLEHSLSFGMFVGTIGSPATSLPKFAFYS